MLVFVFLCCGISVFRHSFSSGLVRTVSDEVNSFGFLVVVCMLVLVRKLFIGFYKGLFCRNVYVFLFL